MNLRIVHLESDFEIEKPYDVRANNNLEIGLEIIEEIVRLACEGEFTTDYINLSPYDDFKVYRPDDKEYKISESIKISEIEKIFKKYDLNFTIKNIGRKGEV